MYSNILAILATAAAVAGTVQPSRAQAPSDTLRLADAVRVARAANPGLAAARLMADAAAEQVGPAGALPDPQLSLGLMNRPVGGFGTAEPMTMNSIGLSQMIPWPGRLGAQRDQARRLAAAERLDAHEAEAQLVRRVRVLYHELAYMDRALVIMGRTRELLQQFFEVSQTRYGVGEGLQQDVLQAQVAVARMTEEIVAMRSGRVAMGARLNALLGREATAPIGGLEQSALGDSLPPVDALVVRALAARPAIGAADERVLAAAAGERTARAELFPDLMIGISYGQRPQFGDMVSVMIGVSLPLWARASQLPTGRAMTALRAGAEARVQDLRNETFADITELRADAEQARALTQLYTTAILPQARAAVESALSAYRVGRVDFATLIDNEMTVNRYEIELARLAARYHQAVAGIDALLSMNGDDQ